MEQENRNEDKIINISFFPKSFDWFIVQSKKFQLAQRRDIDLEEPGNVTQASCMTWGSNETCPRCLRNEPALLSSDMVNA